MTDKEDIRKNKHTAVDFLELVVAGNIEEAYAKYVDMQGKHHNVYFAAGFPTLKQAMLDNHVKFPIKQLYVKQVLGDGESVAVHSKIILKQGGAEMVVVHIFRFENGKIVEMWDIGQEIPPDSPNQEGAI